MENIKDIEDDLILHYNNIDDKFTSIDIKGNIYDKNGELICIGLPLAKEYSLKDDLMFLKNKNYKVYKSFDCTILRLFNYNNQWVLSTFRKINAYKSRWGIKSFGELYDECIKTLNFNLKNLEEDKIFIFLIIHPENGLVCLNTKPKIYHIKTFCRYVKSTNAKDVKDVENIKNKDEKEIKEINCNIGIKSLKDLKLDYDGIIEYVKNIDIAKYSGVLIIDSDNKYYKIYNNDYIYLRSIRGDEPNIMIRYLELENNEEKFYLSKRFNIDITILEAGIKELTKYIYSLYSMRKKNIFSYIKYPNIYNFIKNLEKENKNNEINIEFIERKIRKHPKNLYYCLKDKCLI